MTCEDPLITATALQGGHIVVTRNRDHFTPSSVGVFDPLKRFFTSRSNASALSLLLSPLPIREIRG